MKNKSLQRISIGFMLVFLVSIAFNVNHFFMSAVLFFIVVSILVCFLNWQYALLFFYFFSLCLVLFIIGLFDDPLTSVDANKFYQQAFGDGYYGNTLLDMLRQGHIPIVHSYSAVIVFISNALSTQSPSVIAFLNIVFHFLASAILARGSSYYIGLKNKEELTLFLLMLLSPTLLNHVGVMQKDSFVYFITALASILMALSLRKKSYFLFVISMLALALATLLRPYSVIFVIAYLFVWNVITLPLVAFLSLLISLVGIYWQGFWFIRTALLSFLAIFATPNFTKAYNWNNFTLMTLESTFLSLIILPLGLGLILNRDIRKVFYALCLSALVIALVTVNRLISDQSYDLEGDLLADDISRKKIQLIPMIYLLFVTIAKKVKSSSILNGKVHI